MNARAVLLRLWLAVMALSTLNALRIVLTAWPDFVAFFPGARTPFAHAFAIALPVSLLVALAGLWFWRRWALWLIALATVATLLFDVLMRGPALHLAAALVSAVVLAALAWTNRGRFVATGDPPAT